MNDELAGRAQDLMEAALALECAERAAFLDAECGTVGPLRAEVDSLLGASARAGEFLETPALSSGSPAPAHRLIGQRVGRYSIDSVIASGGMGTVYLATQEDPQRRVALKVMSNGLMSRTAWRRFEHESQILGRLRHPNIAKVYEAGTHDDGSGGVPFFAMEYIADARTITEHVRADRLDLPARLALFAKVCDAVHHGHQKSIIHRDLKPENILVDARGEPHVIDFGVARVTDADLVATSERTAAGQIIGTLQYMSPEQCAADPALIDVRSDVYALGVVLYEILCDRPPYDFEDGVIFDAGRVIREQPPARMSFGGRTLRGDVETIVGKALEKDPGRRYQSAAELADDLRRYLTHEPIRAPPPTFVYQARMFARRNRAFVATLSIVMVVLVAAAAVSFVFGVRARKERDAAIREAYAARIAAGESAHQAGEFQQMRALLDQAPEAHRHWEWRYLMRQAEPSLVALVAERPAAGLAVSPDGTRTATVTATALTVIDVVSGGEVASFPVGVDRPLCVAFSPDGTALAHGGHDRAVTLREAGTGVVIWTAAGHDERVMAVAFDSAGNVISGSLDGTVRTWDARDGRAIGVRVAPGAYVWSLTVSADGGRIAAGLHGDIHIWNTRTGTETTLRRHTHVVDGIAFSPDGTRLVSGAWDDLILVWNVDTGSVEVEVDGHADRVGAVAFSPDGARIASGSRDNTVRTWDAATGEAIGVFRGHADEITGVAFAMGGSRLVSTAQDASTRVWDARPSIDRDTWRGHENRVGCVAFSPDSATLASASTDATIKLWDVPTGDVLATLAGHDGEVISVSFSPDGAHLASGSVDRTIRMWSMDTREPIWSIDAHEEQLYMVSFSPLGDLVASGSGDGTVGVWRAATGDVAARFTEHLDQVICVAFSPDGSRIASGARDGVLVIRDAGSGADARILQAHDARIEDLAWSPDGTMIATASWDFTVRLWDARSGIEIAVLRGHAQNAASVAFSPDGMRLASGSKDKTIRIWDIPGRRDLLALRGHTRTVQSLAFSPDGTCLASSGGWGDPTVRIWDAGER